MSCRANTDREIRSDDANVSNTNVNVPDFFQVQHEWRGRQKGKLGVNTKSSQ